MRLVFLVLVSVASPSLGPYYTLLGHGALLAVFMMWHDLQKPYKDLCLQQLQTLAYLVLLANVGLAIIVTTANSRPGPRAARSQQAQPSELNLEASLQLHCPNQQRGASGTSLTVFAASITMVGLNALFGVAACLIVYSLCTRKRRGKRETDQLLQLATGGATFWVLGLGFNESSKFGVPVVHAGYWTEGGKVEKEEELSYDATQHCWVITAFVMFFHWLRTVVCKSLFWWPAVQTPQEKQQPAASPSASVKQQQSQPQKQQLQAQEAEGARLIFGGEQRASAAADFSNTSGSLSRTTTACDDVQCDIG
jgi:hypothetical protein